MHCVAVINFVPFSSGPRLCCRRRYSFHLEPLLLEVYGCRVEGHFILNGKEKYCSLQVPLNLCDHKGIFKEIFFTSLDGTPVTSAG